MLSKCIDPYLASYSKVTISKEEIKDQVITCLEKNLYREFEKIR